MLLSLCIIARDEEEWIVECIRSVRGLVDETIVVDTGSRDRTVALAREEGARIAVLPWNDDFAEARNRCLAEAQGDWVLVLDADERLYPRHFAAVRRLMENSWADGVQVFVRTYSDDSTLLGWMPIDPAQAESRGFCGYFDLPQVRLFRRRGTVRFEGIVHETVVPSLVQNGLSIYRADVLIHHYKERRNAAEREARNRHILELSRRRVDRAPQDPPLWYQRALAALEVGEQAEAVSALERAVALAPDNREMHLHLVLVLTLAGRAADACRAAAEALERFPDEPELLQALGEAQLAAGRTADARETLSRSLELDPYLYRSLAALGAIALGEEHEAAAVEYFAKAKSIHAGLDAPYLDLGLYYVRKKRWNEALSELRRAFAINPRRWQSLAGIGAVLFETGRYEEAREWYRKAAEAKERPAEVCARLAACCIALGQLEEARAWAEQAAAESSAWAGLPARLASQWG